MRFYEKAMIAVILALIIASLIFGPRAIALFFSALLAAAVTTGRNGRDLRL